ncbi:HAD family phosphatase [Actinosynnema sp. NPDC020468]|uniref:HAD family hydrolase n=1 Tax=Actinosynnema sp. NPDC020468 TaxID=3154488 RepID=UPI0033FD267A
MRWIVFDYGEVISGPQRRLPELAGLAGVPAEEFATAYWAARDAYDRGGSDLEFWRAVVPGVAEELAAELTEVDIGGWLTFDPATLELIAELDAAGVPLALLSNAPSSFGRRVEGLPWARHFRHLVFSGDLKTAKPDPEIWTALVTRLGAQPGDCVFLDDRPVNVEGATRAGLIGVRWDGSVHAREELVRLAVLSGSATPPAVPPARP